MAIPAAELAARGEEFGRGAEREVLIAGYNFSLYLSNRESSLHAQLSRTGFHLHEEYAAVKLKK